MRIPHSSVVVCSFLCHLCTAVNPCCGGEKRRTRRGPALLKNGATLRRSRRGRRGVVRIIVGKISKARRQRITLQVRDIGRDDLHDCLEPVRRCGSFRQVDDERAAAYARHAPVQQRERREHLRLGAHGFGQRRRKAVEHIERGLGHNLGGAGARRGQRTTQREHKVHFGFVTPGAQRLGKPRALGSDSALLKHDNAGHAAQAQTHGVEGFIIQLRHAKQCGANHWLIPAYGRAALIVQKTKPPERIPEAFSHG